MQICVRDITYVVCSYYTGEKENGGVITEELAPSQNINESERAPE